MDDSFTNWLIAGGARLDDTDPRTFTHLVALREAKRQARLEARRGGSHTSPMARLAGHFAFQPTTRAMIDATTLCCAA